MVRSLPLVLVASFCVAVPPAIARDRQAPPGGVLPPALQRHQIVVVRRPGCRDYEKVVEEFKGRVRASVRLLPVGHEPKRLVQLLQRIGPHLVFAVGQSAYDRLRDAAPLPLLHALVFHDIAGQAHETAIPGRVSPARVLSALRLAVPRLRHVAVLHGPRSRQALQQVLAAANQEGFTLYLLTAATPAKAIVLLRRMDRRARALWLLTDLDILTPQVLQYTLGIQFRRHVIVMGATRRHAEHGALMAMDYEPDSIGRCAADLANQTLAGVPRAKLDTSAVAVRLCVNKSTARTLGVQVARLKAAGAELVQ